VIINDDAMTRGTSGMLERSSTEMRSIGRAVGVVLLAAAATSCLRDAPAAPDHLGDARIAFSAMIIGAGAVNRTAEIDVSYRRTDTSRVLLPSTPKSVTVASGTTLVPVTVNLLPCLNDPQRFISTGRSGCRLVIEVRLLGGGGSVTDTTRSEPSDPAIPGGTVNVPPVTLFVKYPLTLSPDPQGSGSGRITSSPAGIDCVFTGTTTSGACSPTFRAGTSVTLTATPAVNSEFRGWGSTCPSTGPCVVIASQALTLPVGFGVKQLRLDVAPAGAGTGRITASPAGSNGTINCLGGGNATPSGTCNATFPYATTVTFTAAPAIGSAFSGWSGACTGTAACTVQVTDTASVTATFALTTFRVNIQLTGTGNGRVTSNPPGSPPLDCRGGGSPPSGVCSTDYIGIPTITLTATPNAPDTFGEWGGDAELCHEQITCTLPVLAALNVTVRFNAATGVNLAPRVLLFNLPQFSSLPPATTVNVSTGASSPLSISLGAVNYGNGPTGWLSIGTLSSGTTPSSFPVSLTNASLPPGVYTATIPVSGAGVATATLTVTLTVGQPSASWKLVPFNFSIDLPGVWGTLPSDVTAVGAPTGLAGSVFHYDGSVFAQTFNGLNATPTSIWGTSASNIYLGATPGSFSGGFSYHSAPRSKPTGAHDGIAADSLIGSAPLYQFNGTTWTPLFLGQEAVMAIAGVSSKNVIVVGEAGYTNHFDGTTWTRTTLNTGATLNGLWMPSAFAAFAVGNSGVIARFDGTSWSFMTSPTIQSLRGVWGSSTSDIWAVGDGGAILHYDGSTWRALTPPVAADLHGVWGTAANNIWAVGDLGTILHYDGLTWRKLPAVSGSAILAIFGFDATNIFAVGREGTVLRYSAP
jgi:hypothetical protein